MPLGGASIVECFILELVVLLLMECGLVLSLVEKKVLIPGLILMRFSWSFGLLVFLVVGNLGYDGAEMFLDCDFWVIMFEDMLVLFVFFEVLVDDFLHVVVLLRPVEIDLVLAAVLDGLMLTLPPLLHLQVAFLRAEGRV
jgi:hypothetical protein